MSKRNDTCIEKGDGKGSV